MPKNIFTFKLSNSEQSRLIDLLREGNYRPETVKHTKIAVSIPDCRINLYTSGKLVAQGKRAHEWITFTLEPLVLLEARIGYNDVHNPEDCEPHMGIDESGKGDYFGPLVIAAAYVDEDIVPKLEKAGVRDSKKIGSDKKAKTLAQDIRKILGGQFSIVQIGPKAYNRLYGQMKNVNRILAWGHARAIENLLEKTPACPRAVCDKFGPARQVKRALMKKGRTLKLVQHPQAESDPAVAAASILARASFLAALENLEKITGRNVPKGASKKVLDTAVEMVSEKGPQILSKTVKCHFKTSDKVLRKAGYTREDI